MQYISLLSVNFIIIMFNNNVSFMPKILTKSMNINLKTNQANRGKSVGLGLEMQLLAREKKRRLSAS